MSESERLETRRDAVTMDERVLLDYLREKVEPNVNKCGDDDVDDKIETSSTKEYCSQRALWCGRWIALGGTEDVKTLDKGRLEAHIDIRILENISAAENYLTLNELIPSSWRLAPTTPLQQPFVTFSERELALFFWRRPLLKQRLVELAPLDEDRVSLHLRLRATSSNGFAPDPIEICLL
ncbi:hypothetical protein EC957_009126 [Mortierella hygrophila]|uniref:Uncharacterized protein n=1 Tax=Mortierella hygrophila TaxID=979708 RepID=A0A9P6EVQ1_9FUNG|nr:hypothetical protein EC957_009126 [Mortierella hygrophila]